MITPFFTHSYRYILRPVLFKFEPENVHDVFTAIGEMLGNNPITRKFTSLLFEYQNTKLEKIIYGIKFKNPLGLSAGFDYNGQMVKIMPRVGFGFNTVGTVTNHYYEGNMPPRMKRLIKSKSILVNKGFKSDGVDVIKKRLEDPYLENVTFGVSVGASNISEINTIEKAIEDIKTCFQKLKENKYIKYYELNISCPNIEMVDSFYNIKNLSALLNTITELNLQKPIFMKMPNELAIKETEDVVEECMKHNITGFIFSNLIKDRNNDAFVKEEIDKVAGLKGNFSGRPTEKNANKLIAHFRKKYGKNIVIIGCGGVFGYTEAKAKLDAGADLIQLVTGLIFEGPQFVGKINKELANSL